MGRRSVLPSYEVLPISDGGIVLVSLISEVEGVDVVGYDITLDGTLSGYARIQHCNDKNPDVNSTWKDLDFGQDIILDAAIDTDNRIQIETSFKHLRLFWTPNGGAGNVSAKIYGLVRGA